MKKKIAHAALFQEISFCSQQTWTFPSRREEREWGCTKSVCMFLAVNQQRSFLFHFRPRMKQWRVVASAIQTSVHFSRNIATSILVP